MPRHLLKHRKPEVMLASVLLRILEAINSSLTATSLWHVGKEEKNALKMIGMENIMDSAFEYNRALTILYN